MSINTQRKGGVFSLKELIDEEEKYRRYKNNRILVLDDEEFCISSMKAIFFTLGIDTNYQLDCFLTGSIAL